MPPKPASRLKSLFSGAAASASGVDSKAVSGYSDRDYDEYNGVRARSNLTYQNINFLLKDSLLNLGLSEAEANVSCDKDFMQLAFVRDSGDKNEGLRDGILNFLGREFDFQKRDKMTFLLVDGKRDKQNRIAGGSHWSVLHLRREGNSITPYYMDSFASRAPDVIRDVFASVKNVKAGDIAEMIIRKEDGQEETLIGDLSEVNKRALRDLKNIKFEDLVELKSRRQDNFYDCGLYCVYNGLMLNFAGTEKSSVSDLGSINEQSAIIFQDEPWDMKSFCNLGRVLLQEKFPSSEKYDQLTSAIAEFLIDPSKSVPISNTSVYQDAGLAHDVLDYIKSSKMKVSPASKLAAICRLDSRFQDKSQDFDGQDVAILFQIYESLDFAKEIKEACQKVAGLIDESVYIMIGKKELLEKIRSDDFADSIYKEVEFHGKKDKVFEHLLASSKSSIDQKDFAKKVKSLIDVMPMKKPSGLARASSAESLSGPFESKETEI